jgi:hypothetical protein
MITLFCDLTTGLTYKQENPDAILVISVGHSPSSFDSLWDDPEIRERVSAIGIAVVRLTEAENLDDIRRFAARYAVTQIPCFAVFGDNDQVPSAIWTEAFPSAAEFLDFLAHQTKSSEKMTQISVRTNSRTSLRDFPATATLADLKLWIRTEFGREIPLVVSHLHAPLPADDDVTLAEAGLTPSAILTEVVDTPRLSELAALPRLHREGARPRGLLDLIFACVKFVMSLLNPWDPGEDVESFWEYPPSPERRRM